MRGFEISTIHGGSFNCHMRRGFLQIHLVFHLTAVLAPYLLWQPKNLCLQIHMFCSKTTLRSFLLKVFLMVCVCVCVCVCVYVCVCVCISFHHKGFWLNKANVVPEAQVSDGMLRKYFCVKCLCRHVIDNRSRNLQANNCAKECQLNPVEPQKTKYNSEKLSNKQQQKRKA